MPPPFHVQWIESLRPGSRPEPRRAFGARRAPRPPLRPLPAVRPTTSPGSGSIPNRTPGGWSFPRCPPAEPPRRNSLWSHRSCQSSNPGQPHMPRHLRGIPPTRRRFLTLRRRFQSSSQRFRSTVRRRSGTSSALRTFRCPDCSMWSSSQHPRNRAHRHSGTCHLGKSNSRSRHRSCQSSTDCPPNTPLRLPGIVPQPRQTAT